MPAASKTSSKAVRLHALFDIWDDRSIAFAQTPREGYSSHTQFPVPQEGAISDKVERLLEKPPKIPASTSRLVCLPIIGTPVDT